MNSDDKLRYLRGLLYDKELKQYELEIQKKIIAEEILVLLEEIETLSWGENDIGKPKSI